LREDDIAQIAKKKQVSGVVVIGFIDRPIDLIESYCYLKVPFASFNIANALGYATCLALHYGADFVLMGAYPGQSYALLDKKQPEAHVLIDLTAGSKEVGNVTEMDNDILFSLLVTKQASFMAYFLAQLPRSLSQFALITIILRIYSS
jgi:hypothetical protein